MAKGSAGEVHYSDLNGFPIDTTFYVKLEDEEKELLKELKSMDDVMPRPTPEAQKTLLDRLRGQKNEEVDHEALEDEFKVG